MPRHSIRQGMKAERALMIGSVTAILVMLGLVLFLLRAEYQNARQVALRSAKNVVELIDSDLQRNVELYDQSLQGLADATQNPDLAHVPASLRRQLLFGRAITVPSRGDILWIDERGRVVEDSLSAVPRQLDFSEHENFLAHQASSSTAVHISRPFRDQLGTLDWCIAFTRRISGPNGAFKGMASGVLRLGYFSTLFKSLNIGRGSVSLANTQGDLLAREPNLAGGSSIGQNLADLPNMQHMLTGEASGYFIGESSLDGRPRFYVYNRVSGLPLLVIVAMAYDDVFGAWQRTAWFICVATLGMCLGIAWLTLSFRRELHRGRRSETSLAALAATDPLTGLANRRHLDQALDMEWARAQRSGRGIAVLMIDVDHFGVFNETHGHHGGDEALRAVAWVIGQHAQRPGDLAARYGGEEFMVVLVEATSVGSLAIAERIRHQVEQLLPLSNTGISVTVSIGVATRNGASAVPATLSDLLASADAALYRAKREGRNQVCHAQKEAKKTPA